MAARRGNEVCWVGESSGRDSGVVCRGRLRGRHGVDDLSASRRLNTGQSPPFALVAETVGAAEAVPVPVVVAVVVGAAAVSGRAGWRVSVALARSSDLTVSKFVLRTSERFMSLKLVQLVRGRRGEGGNVVHTRGIAWHAKRAERGVRVGKVGTVKVHVVRRPEMRHMVRAVIVVVILNVSRGRALAKTPNSHPLASDACSSFHCFRSQRADGSWRVGSTRRIEKNACRTRGGCMRAVFHQYVFECDVSGVSGVPDCEVALGMTAI